MKYSYIDKFTDYANDPTPLEELLEDEVPAPAPSPPPKKSESKLMLYVIIGIFSVLGLFVVWGLYDLFKYRKK